MANKVQLNFQVKGKLAAKVRADARRFGKTLDTVGETILEDFFAAFSLLERCKFYESGAEVKRAGRRIGGGRRKRA